MKKPKFLMKVDSNKNAKIYMNKHWLKDVTWVSVEGDLDGYHIEFEHFIRDSKGKLIIEYDEVKKKVNAVTIKRRG